MAKWEWNNEESKLTLERGYLMPGETVRTAAKRIAASAAKYSGDEWLEKEVYDAIAKGWLVLPSPIWSNMGVDRGLPISCFGSYISDSMESIMDTLSEAAFQTKNGGGTSGYFGDLRPNGATIKGGGKSNGPVAFMQMFDTAMRIISQGTRRGSFAAYLPIEHPDILDFLKIRSFGDPIQQLSIAVTVTDDFMNEMIEGDSDKRKLWAKVLNKRKETGYPYIMFVDTVNRLDLKPIVYKDKRIVQSNLCISGDQRVVSSLGYLTAKELYDLNQDLILFDGEKPVKSSKMFLREEKAKVYRVTLENGLEHKITDYHELPVLDSQNNITKIPCNKLKIGDKIAIQTQKGLFGPLSMEKEAFLLGMYQSDGTQTKVDLMLDVWEQDFDLLDEIQESFNYVHTKYKCDSYTIVNQAGTTARIRPRKAATFHDCVVSQSKVKKKRLTSRTLKKSLNFEKGYIPDWIWRSNEKTQWAYVRGLYYADGTINIAKSKGNPIYLSYTDIKLPFLKDLQLLLNNLGLQSSIRVQREAGQSLLPDGRGGKKFYNTKKSWRLMISNKNSALEFERNTGFLSRKKQILENKAYRDNSKKGYKILSIEYIGEEPVYCPTVESKEHIFIAQGMKTGNCNEIMLPVNETESFVCCITALSGEKYEEWKDTNLVEIGIRFLDAVMQEFITKASSLPHMGRSVEFARNHRALGLGFTGWHSLLQSQMIPFDSLQARIKSNNIFKRIREQAEAATLVLGREKGEPLICKGTGRRNSSLMAFAPNTTSSSINWQCSQGIEPFNSNYFLAWLGKGSFPRKNKYLEVELERLKMNTKKIWGLILKNGGSIQHIPELKEIHEVFKTFGEINQYELLTQAGERQRYIDQGQSLNIHIPPKTSVKIINDIHIHAWKSGVKGLYYQRSSSPSSNFSLEKGCVGCAG